VLAREGGEGEQGGRLREALREVFDHPCVLSPDRGVVGRGEDRQVADEVNPTTLPPGSRQHGRHRLPEAKVVVGDHEADADPAAGNQAAPEAGPGRTIFGREDRPGSPASRRR
jgi:hypothetical protein